MLDVPLYASRIEKRRFLLKSDYPLKMGCLKFAFETALLCYNVTNEKPRPLGEVAAKPTERAQLCAKNPLTRYCGSSPKGRAYGRARPSLGVWTLPDMGLSRCPHYFTVSHKRTALSRSR